MQLIRTLLVDDDYLVLEDLKQLIDWEACGFQIIGTASNGKQALEILSQKHPSLIITDISMPVMDGFDFVEAAQKDSNSTYYIFLSSYASFEYARRALEQEVSSYLLKNELTADMLMEHLQKARERIQGTATSKQQAFSHTVQDLFEQENPSASDLSLSGSKHYVFFYLAKHLPLEKLPHHFRRAAHTGQELENRLSESELSLPSDRILFSLNELAILGIPAESQAPMSYYEIYEFYNQLRASLPSSENALIFCYPQALSLSDGHRIFRSYYRLLKFCTLFPDTCEWDLSKYSGIAKESNSNPPMFPYSLIGTSLEQPDVFIREAESFVEQCFCCYDSDSLLMFFHNLMIQLEDLSDHMLQFETEAFVSEKKALIAELSQRYQQLVQYRTRSRRSELSSWMNAAVDYMEAHYSDRDLSVNDIAASVGLSSSRFSVLFRQETDQTVNDYLTELRIRKAIHLLEHSNLKMYEIAEKVGYQSSQYFSRIFFQKTGYKPLHFRQKRPT